MALVASPARSAGPGSLTQHGPQPSHEEGYEHPQPASPGDPALSATPLPSAITQPGPQSHLGIGLGIEPERFRAAGFFRRAAAALIDISLLLPVCAVFGLALCLAFGQPIPRLAELSPDLLVAALLDGNAASEALL